MVRLRNLEEKDKLKVLEWRNSETVSEFMYSEHEITLAEHEVWFENAINSKNGYHWIIEHENIDVGLASIANIDKKNRRCSTGFYLINAETRKGIGTFVKYSLINWSFNELSFEKVYSEHLAFNKPIVELNKKMGLSQEGYFRSHIFKNEEFHDVIYMSILQNEWSEKKQKTELFLKEKGLM